MELLTATYPTITLFCLFEITRKGFSREVHSALLLLLVEKTMKEAECLSHGLYGFLYFLCV